MGCLFYKKFRRDIESIGFTVNPYDACVANRTIQGTQHTVVWHVDDIKSSHINPRVNDEFLEWLIRQYGEDEIGKVKATRGSKHNYLGINLEFLENGELIVDMKKYIEEMLQEFPIPKNYNSKTPWNEQLFKIDKNSKRLETIQHKLFHGTVMKGMFLMKRGRPDIGPGVSLLTTRVTKPNQDDWNKLMKMMSFLKNTKNDLLTLYADDTQSIQWYLDASLATHSDLKSHTGACMTLGKGMLVCYSTKQKVNSRSLTEAELNGIDDKISKI